MSQPTDPPNDAAKAEFTALYGNCAPWLYGYLFAILRNPEDAEEVLQETAATAWEKFDQYQRDTEFRAWACRIAFYKAQNFRRRKREQPSPFSDLFLELADEETVVMTDRLDARSAALKECMQKLPPEDRKLLKRRHIQSWRIAALARSIGRSHQTVYRSLHRIYGLMFDCIERTLKEEAAK